mmetsp:Transcript_3023/g.4459  ORF Transcript_3023/g.4459 Transcript_3023/m.4459 type:complete len:614 (+) Transcript_3023:284-2125(+)
MNNSCHHTYFQFVILLVLSLRIHQHHHPYGGCAAFQYQIRTIISSSTTTTTRSTKSSSIVLLQASTTSNNNNNNNKATATSSSSSSPDQQKNQPLQLPHQPAAQLSEPCNVVFTHTNADFDSLAAAVALSLLWSHQDPSTNRKQKKIPTHVVLPRGMHPVVQRFVAFHKHLLPLRGFKTIRSEDVHAIGVVDAQSANRIGRGQSWLKDARSIHVFDHHDGQTTTAPSSSQPLSSSNNNTATATTSNNNTTNNTTNNDTSSSSLTQMATELIIDKVGSVTTLIVERLKEAGIQPAPHEATLFVLGIRADTGGLVYDSTTIRDARALLWCMENGASQNAISEFGVARLPPEQRQILNIALQQTQTTTHRGLRLSSVLIQEQGDYVAGLAQVCEEMMGLTDSDVFLLGATHTSSGSKQKKNNNNSTEWISLIGRATVGAMGVNLNAVLSEWGGGGHPKAAAAAVRCNETFTPEDVLNLAYNQVKQQVPEQLVASSFMSEKVTTVSTEDTVESALQLYKEQKIKSAPVVDSNGFFMGSLKYNDLVQAMRKSTSSNRVKGLMRSTAATVLPDTSLAELEYLIMTKGVGRLPVVDEDGLLVGLVTRTDVLRQHDLYDDI